jgi:hypothetical protein
LTKTRFRRRPSRLPGQRFRLAQDLLPGTKVEPPVGDRHDDLAAHGKACWFFTPSVTVAIEWVFSLGRLR